MNNPLALVASLVATFVLGAVVALYGFGSEGITADAVGCWQYRPNSVQQEDCVENALNHCQEEYNNRQEQNTCVKAMMGGKVPFTDTKQPAGETQKLHNAGAPKR